MSTTAAKAAALLKRIARRRILVIGDVMLDHYIWGDATRISPEAPVPVVNVSRASDTVGGAANVANTIAALGASVEVVGAIGRDGHGNQLREHLRQGGIAFDEEFLLNEVRTITKTRVIVRNQQLCRLDHEDAPSLYRAIWTPGRLKRLESKISSVDGIILSDYAKGVLHTSVIKQIAAAARKYGKFIALDPKPSSGNQFSGLDLITPNYREALELAGLPAGSDARVDLARLCSVIWKKYSPRNLVITRGADGMLVSHKGHVEKAIPTAARQVYDVSGAGDTVIAALTLALTSGAGLEDSAHFANAAAGVVVGKIGTATVTPEELKAYITA